MKINIDNLYDANKAIIKNDVSDIDEALEYEQILLSISKTITNYRSKNNLTQKELAKKLDINQVMISKLEKGNYNPTIKILYTISRKLTKTSDLFINMLKDIITNLYKSKSIDYSIQFKKYETYRYNVNNENKDNITYLVNDYNDKDYGGMFYGEINSTSRLSANG